MPNPESMTSVLRATCALVDDAMRAGLPEPSTITRSHYDGPTLIMHDFAQVQAWADYLETAVEFYTAFDCDFATTRSDQSDVYGIRVVVTSNRETLGEAAS